MSLNHLSKYLESVEQAIRKLEGAYVERYEEEILTVNRVNLRIRIRFQTGHMLELNEAIIGKKNQINGMSIMFEKIVGFILHKILATNSRKPILLRRT